MNQKVFKTLEYTNGLIYNSRNSLIILNKEIVDNELVISTTVEII